MARKRRKRKTTKPLLSHINERRKSVMKLSIIEHIAASDRKINLLAIVMRRFNWKFVEAKNGKSFAIVTNG